eukprot:TRINITY_DN4341_c0_g1_i1.p1 TRINITY_DN4341_c0_g1~~TRINITY_DN4341_c0_g1_i1.p1  ORF type:complete len:250 (+),score=74.58 TRINITY_DN4341_c0_g1_i1:89-751(+)
MRAVGAAAALCLLCGGAAGQLWQQGWQRPLLDAERVLLAAASAGAAALECAAQHGGAYAGHLPDLIAAATAIDSSAAARALGAAEVWPCLQGPCLRTGTCAAVVSVSACITRRAPAGEAAVQAVLRPAAHYCALADQGEPALSTALQLPNGGLLRRQLPSTPPRPDAWRPGARAALASVALLAVVTCGLAGLAASRIRNGAGAHALGPPAGAAQRGYASL